MQENNKVSFYRCDNDFAQYPGFPGYPGSDPVFLGVIPWSGFFSRVGSGQAFRIKLVNSKSIFL